MSGLRDILPSVGPNVDGVTLCHWAALGLCWKMPAGQKFIGVGPGEWAIQNVSGTKFNLSAETLLAKEHLLHLPEGKARGQLASQLCPG